MTPPAIAVEHLSIGYRNARGEMLHVLRDVSMTIAAGESIGIVGESGCGKSTLALAFMGYLRRGSERLGGMVRFRGEDLFSLGEKRLSQIRGGQIAVIPQNAGQALTPTLRVGAQIAEALRLHTALEGAALVQRVSELLEHVRLPSPAVLARRYPHELSGGQQQRIAIAMAIACEPDVLLLDEPTTGLDTTTQSAILDLLAGLRRDLKVAMICVSHDLGVIARLSERVAVMYAGQIAEAGATDGLLRRPLHPYTRGLLAAIPTIRTAEIPHGIPGRPPEAGAGAGGCAFAERCAHADALCQRENPLLIALADDGQRQVRCHHFVRIMGSTPAAALFRERGAAPGARDVLLSLERLSVSYHSEGALAPVLRAFRPGAAARPRAVHDVQFEIYRGETLALVGQSGSGKSTIVRAIAGLLRPLTGTIAYDGVPLHAHIDARPREVRRAIQIIFQNPDASLNPRHTVAEILAQPLRLYFRLGERECRQRAAALLERMRLNAAYLTRYPAQLSGGEKQRVAIARAFAAQPDVVLCDEITSALDVSVQAAVLELLVDLQRERGTTYVLIAHDLAVVRALADRVAVMEGGRICEIGAVADIYAPPHHPYTEKLLRAALDVDVLAAAMPQ